VETVKPRSVETRSVETPAGETGGRPEGAPTVRLETPAGETGGRPEGAPTVRLETPAGETGGSSPTAATTTVGGGGFGSGRDNFAELVRPVHFQNYPPVSAEGKPLAYAMPPHNRMDAFGSVFRGRGVKAGKLRCGLLAAPCIQVGRSFDDHAAIICIGRFGAQAPTVKTRRFSFPKCPTGTPIVETSGKPDKKILGLTRRVPMLFLGDRGRRRPDRGNQ